MFKFKVMFVCKCGWSEGEDHLPVVHGICDDCADDEAVSFMEEFEEELLFDDEVVRYDGLR